MLVVVGMALGYGGVLLMSPSLDAADNLERLQADISVARVPSSATVRVTDHGVPSVSPEPDPDQQPRTLLELFSSWVAKPDPTLDTPPPPVKVEPRPVQGRTELVVAPEGTERDAIVPIDPAPKIALTPSTPQLSGAASPSQIMRNGGPAAEPLSVLTIQLVSTSLVTASLWGKSPAAEEGPRDELDRFAAASARRLDRSPVPAPRRLVERARPPLNASRVSTSQEGVDFLRPIEPAAAPAIN
ncbi:hypothetical protein [Geminicoccus roseus]|uniref:hypothetical protein n=1 Tax=Geminicoccus roseus TaxID=404900 RepID=UPI00040D613B|nr:hypothetical protein [Geminicoccus roseus]